MTNKSIFISCGQQTEEEKDLGKAVKNVIDETPGFEGYFAQNVQSLDGLSVNIFDALRKCSGFVAFLHDRGEVRIDGRPLEGRRSSVWINQEIAILAFRHYFEGCKIPIKIFKEESINLEGAMTALIANPSPIGTTGEVEEEIRRWIDAKTFLSPTEEEVFHSKWAGLSENHRKVLRALVDLNGKQVNESLLRKHLEERYGISTGADLRLAQARGALAEMDLTRIVNTYTGYEWTLHQSWEWYVRRALAAEDIK